MADHGWMYSGGKHGRPTNEWVDKTNEFLDRAYSIPELVEFDTIKCPCAMCRNYFKHKRPKSCICATMGTKKITKLGHHMERGGETMTL
jgi:hypothetical protein